MEFNPYFILFDCPNQIERILELYLSSIYGLTNYTIFQAETPKSWPSPITSGAYFNFQIMLEDSYTFKLIIDDFENSFAISNSVFSTNHMEVR